MSGVAADFGYSFPCRGRRQAGGYHLFVRSPDDRQAPRTYNQERSAFVVARIRALEGRFCVQEQVELEIGEGAVEGLKGMEIAEISIAQKLPVALLQGALRLYGESRDVLSSARGRAALASGLRGVEGFLTTDYIECSSYVRTETDAFSSRLDGEIGLALSLHESGGPFYRLPIETEGVRKLFNALGRVVPSSVGHKYQHVVFDLLRIYSDGAVFSDTMWVPTELILAQSQ